MHECAEAGHKEIQHVAEKKYDHERQPLPARVVAQNHLAQIVEGSSEHSSGQSEGIETYVGEHISEYARSHIVGVPEAGSYIDERIASRLVEDEYGEGGDD